MLSVFRRVAALAIAVVLSLSVCASASAISMVEFDVSNHCMQKVTVKPCGGKNVTVVINNNSWGNIKYNAFTVIKGQMGMKKTFSGETSFWIFRDTPNAGKVCVWSNNGTVKLG